MPDLLSSQSTVGNLGFLPSGGSSPGVSSGGINWGNLAQGVAPLALSAVFGSNKYQGKTADLAASLKTTGADLTTAGKKTAATGSDALTGILKYFQDLAGGNENAVLGAAGPDRARIIDQYDTAKKSLSTAQRGGGATSAALNLETAKAGQLATATQTARASGAAGAAQVGSTLLSSGVQQQIAGINSTESALKAFEQLTQDKNATMGDWGKAIGTALPFLLAAF